MPFQPVPHTAEAVVRLSANAQLITLTFYGGIASGGDDQAGLDNLTDVMDVWADTELKAVLSEDVTYLGVSGRVLNFLNDFYSFNDTNTGAGSLVSDTMPNNVCLAVKRSSAFTGRSARGRVYMPLAVNQVDPNNPNTVFTGSVGNIVAALNEVRVAMSGVGWSERIVSRYTAGAARAQGITFAVTGYSAVNNTVDTQRRRLP